MNSLPVLVWGERPGLVSDLERSGAQVVVVRRCDDLAEVLAVIGTGITSHAVLAGPTTEITAAFTEALARVGGSGVCLLAQPSEEMRLTRLGLGVVPWDASVETIVSALTMRRRDAPPRGGTPQRQQPGTAPPRGAWSADPADPLPGPTQWATDVVTVPGATTGGPPPASPPVPDGDEPSGTRVPPAAGGRREGGGRGTVSGRITVVWGPHGAPGRSTVALNLAVEEATKGSRVCLVDADTHAAGLGPMLGLMDETAGLVRLTRAVQDGEFDPLPDSAAHARVRVAAQTLRFTSGLPRPQRWAEISAEGLRAALTALAATCDHVVVDVAAEAGQDEDLALDTFAPQRNDATIAALGLADRVVVVGTADSIGLPRLIRACEELPEKLGDRTRVEIVVNKVRVGCTGPRPEASVASAWRRFGPRHAVPGHFLPWDQTAADAALLAGRVLAEAAPRSALRKGIAALALGIPDTPRSGPATAATAGTVERHGRRGRTRQRTA